MHLFLPAIWVRRQLAVLALALGSVLFFGTADLQAQSAYTLRPGDTVRVEVFEDSSLNRDVVVLPDGNISFPFVGTMKASGRSLPQLQEALIGGLASNFASRPNVFVSLPVVPALTAPSVSTIDIYFLGEVAQPGRAALAPGTTLLQALAEIGGFSVFAAKKRVQLRRIDSRTGAQSLHTLNYKALAKGGALSNDIVLQDGDVILVPERRLFE